MGNTSTHPPKLIAKTTRWSIGKIYLLNAVFGTIIAVIIWLALRQDNNVAFLSSWIHAQFIGGIICTLILFTEALVRRNESVPKQLLVFVMPLIVVAGYFLGKELALFTLQLPFLGGQANTDQYTSLLPLVITVVVTVAITWFFTAQSTISDLRIKSAEESERAAQAHLAMLIAQVEPHMLFNTLANLRALIPTEPDKACAMLDSLIEFLRATLSHSKKTSVPLMSECQLLEHYLTLMKIRMGDRLSYAIELPSSLQNCLVPSLLLQPLVENAITHGIEPSIEGGHINVVIGSHEGFLKIKVEDSGVGMANLSHKKQTIETVSSDGGFGLANVRARCVALPDGQFDIVSPISDNGRGTGIYMQLPINQHT